MIARSRIASTFNLFTRYSMSFLHIAEKNSIAKQVASVLSGGNRRTGTTLSKFNPVFLFELDSQEHTFSSVRGHIFQYILPPQCKTWNTYDNRKILTRETPMLKRPGKDMEDLIANLQKLARGKRQLVLWLDCDREGEAIAFEVLDVILRVNPNIKIHRARFSAVTHADIMQAYNNLVKPNQLEADAVNYRIQIDFRMGCAFTRAQTVAFTRIFRFKEHSVLSYGPCQIPTLCFVVERYLEIKNFKPEKYWFIAGNILLSADAIVPIKWEKGNTRNQQEANIIFADMYLKAHRGGGKIEGKILKRNKKEKKKNRPFPLTTVQFQKLATDKLKISSADAMKIAQKLYQNGFISYPRTETNSFPPTMMLPDLVKRLQPCDTYNNYVGKLLNQGKFLNPKMGNQNDQAHSPIHPVKPADQQSMSAQEWRVYDLITRHFLACCSKDAVGLQSEIVADIGGQVFKASHLAIKQKNYLQIYPFEKWVESQFPGQIPEVFEASVELKESKTQPPGYLTESDLISLMEKNQIGTDSTIHEHIQTIQDRKYAVKTSNTFKPTNLGASLIVTYKLLGLRLEDCQIRRMIENRMNKIAEGSLLKETATLETLQEVTPIFEQFKNNQQEWLNQMNTAMQEHQGLKQVEVQTGSQLISRLQRQNTNQTSQQHTGGVICFKCGKPGHVVTNCPDRMNGNSNIAPRQQPKRPQNKSNNPNNTHVRENNNGDNTFNRGIVCYLCRQPGHLTTQCPNRDNQNQRPERSERPENNQQSKKFACFICGKQGHFAPTCPERKDGGKSQATTKPQKPNDNQAGIVCFSCNKPGHFASNCPDRGKSNTNNYQRNNDKPKNNVATGQKVCRSCGVVGRHPRGSTCDQVRRNKGKEASGDEDN